MVRCTPVVAALLGMVGVCARGALGQPIDSPIPADRAFPMTPADIQGGDYMSHESYSPRSNGVVYAVGNLEQTGGFFAASGMTVYDDATFVPICTAHPGAVEISGMAIGFNLPAVFPSPHGDHIYTRITFYPDHNNAVAPSAFPYSGTGVMATVDWGSGWTVGASPNSVRYYADPITFGHTIAVLDTSNVFTGGPADHTCGVKIEMFLDAALTIRADNFGVARRAAFTSYLTGSSDTFSWYDMTNQGNGELINSSRSGGGALGQAGNCRATYQAFQAGGFTTDCGGVGVSDLGCLADGTTSVSGVVVSTGELSGLVKWYKFCLPADATDNAGIGGQFLDLDTEGSQASFALGLYDGDTASPSFGNLIAFDRASGSGNNSQLSFGMGRRSAVGDGRQYDGRNFYAGARGLGVHNLYIAVAPLDSQFADGFDVAPIGAGGPFSLHLSTNVSGAPLASSIPPIPDIDLHSVSGDTPVPLGVLAGSDVRWVKLRVCRAASADHPLSADLVGTNAPSSSMTLFSGGGNIVAQSVSLTSAPAAPLSFASDGSLAAGVYDLAISSGSVQTAVNGAANGRWHVRSTALGSGGTFAATIHAASSGCPTCNADFNGDGDFGTDADIRDFFACLGGNCCSACGTVDFNGDGDVGTDSDIESFFRVLAGGSR